MLSSLRSLHQLATLAVASLALALLLVACGSETDAAGEDGGASGPADLGPNGDGGGGSDVAVGHDASSPDGGDGGVLHELTELTIIGKVSLDYAAPGSRVQVEANCGEQQVQTMTSDDGFFQLTTNVEACNQLVVGFSRESYLPNYRVVHLPPPTSPVTMNVVMTALKELQCGDTYCVVEGDPISRFPVLPELKRGWVAVMGGPNAVDYVGGEFRTTEGNLLWVTGFGYFDLRDQDGVTSYEFPEFEECFQVTLDSMDQIVDVSPGDSYIQMSVYKLETANGRWRRLQKKATVKRTEYEDGNPVLEPVSESRKEDLRSGQLGSGIWVCAPVDGSGWLAWGIDIPQRSCISLYATNQCGSPLPNVVFTVRGRGVGFKAETWTDRLGRACLEAARSEEVGADFNYNDLGGETFWLNADLNWQSGSQIFNSIEIPRQDSGCDNPDECIPLTHTFLDFSVECGY